MIEFHIPAISCGHCVRAVNEAIHEVDPAAQVEVDLARKRVQVESTSSREALVHSLKEAGYSPQTVQAP